MRAGRRVVALIEDDPVVRWPLAQGLDAAGYIVLGAASGPEGLQLLENPDVDVALVDVRLSGRLDGIGVVREARRFNPKLKAALMSGRRPVEDVSDIGPFLAKPISLGALVTTIEAMLADYRTAAPLRGPITSRPR